MMKEEETEEKTPLLGNGISEINYTEEGSKEKSKEKTDTRTASFGELERVALQEEWQQILRAVICRIISSMPITGLEFRTATCLDVLLMILGTLAALVHGAGWPVLFIFFGDMTDQFVSGPGGTMNGTINETVKQEMLDEFNRQMTKYSLYYVYIGASVFVASFVQVGFWTMACERQVHRIRKQFFHAIMRQEIGWFDVHQSGELTTRLADDLERVREGLGDKVSFIFQFLAQFIAGFTIGFVYGWKLALVMMSLTPLLAVCGAFLSKLVANFSKREQESYAQAGSVAEEVLSCIRTVTSLNGQKQDLKRYETALEHSKKLGIRKSYITGFGLGFTFLCMFSAYALAFWFGTEQVKDWYDGQSMDPIVDQGISPGTVLTVFFCVLVGTFSIGNITPHVTTVAGAKGAAAVLIDIIDNKPSIDASAPGGKVLRNIKGHIRLKGVKFAYPTRNDVTILKNFSLAVEPGQTVALVGPSGCGKSTVINLIQRFYDPEEGSVEIDGENLKDVHIKALRDSIGVVSQEPILFGITIRENILLGNPGARQEEIIEAAKAANCHDFIQDLPQGYNTLVGERGAQLSGGQKQRVAIARALIRDPKILLLDEATSALDTESERIVQKALDNARKGRTTIVIAHRLSTIQNADVIYVVQDGQIVESGKHQDLMAKQGEYYQLVTVQMLAEEELEGNDDIDDIEISEIGDAVPNGIHRKRTLSAEEKLARRGSKLGRQMSRQLSHTTSKVGIAPQLSKVEDGKVEEETAEKPKYCRMLHTNAPEWPWIVLGCIAAGINGCTMPAFAIFFGEMIKVFVSRGSDSVFWSMMFLMLGGVQFITNFISTVSFGQSGEKLTMRLRLNTFYAMLRQDISYFDDPKHSTGALTTRLATDASQVKNATGIRIATLVQSAVGLVAALAIAFVYGWKLALVVLGGVPLMALAGALQMKTVMGNQKRDTEELEMAGKIASEAIENIRTVQSLTREEHFYNKYADYLAKPFRTNIKLAQVYALAFGFSQGIVFMIYAGAFRFGAYMVSLEEMSPDNVYKVFFAISLTGLVIGQSASFLPDYSKALNAAGLIFKILDTVPLIDVFSKRGQYPSKLAGTVEFRDVRFNYPTRPDVPVLKGINLKVEAGQTVALVGPSGCGKSTVVSLIQRFYDPEQGSVLVDGTDVKDINLVRLRYLVSIVSQEPILFGCSIKDNISYGLDTPLSMDEIITVARAANIHEFVSSLPQGYDTEVGEKGTQLSGGQKQRVAIARALIRNPRILLLDEATSALDTESEQLVQQALDQAQEGRTCIVIAHRLSTVQNADVIYVIDNGQIVEFGNHQQLLNKHGVYAQLVSAQQLSK